MKFLKKNKDLDLFYLDTYDAANEVEGCGCTPADCGCTKNECPNVYEGCASKKGTLSDAILPIGTIYV